MIRTTGAKPPVAKHGPGHKAPARTAAFTAVTTSIDRSIPPPPEPNPCTRGRPPKPALARVDREQAVHGLLDPLALLGCRVKALGRPEDPREQGQGVRLQDPEQLVRPEERLRYGLRGRPALSGRAEAKRISAVVRPPSASAAACGDVTGRRISPGIRQEVHVGAVRWIRIAALQTGRERLAAVRPRGERVSGPGKTLSSPAGTGYAPCQHPHDQHESSRQHSLGGPSRRRRSRCAPWHTGHRHPSRRQQQIGTRA